MRQRQSLAFDTASTILELMDGDFSLAADTGRAAIVVVEGDLAIITFDLGPLNSNDGGPGDLYGDVIRITCRRGMILVVAPLIFTLITTIGATHGAIARGVAVL